MTYQQQQIFLSILFADDTTFQISDSNINELFLKANTELLKASNWFSSNRLTLNIKKTKYMLFRPKNIKVNFDSLCLKIGNENIDRIGKGCKTSFFKFVGIHLDEFLDWDAHCAHVAAKISSGNFIISRSKNVFPINIRKNIYNSLVRSHMEFGILSWGTALQGKLKHIVQLQKKCIRNVAGKDIRSHTDPLFKKLNILKFYDLVKYNQCTFMHKLLNGKQPDSFDNFFIKAPNFESDTNRRCFCYVVDLLKNKTVGRFPTATLPRTWNSIDQSLKLVDSHSVFKKDIYYSLIDQYPTSVNCRNKSCPDYYNIIAVN